MYNYETDIAIIGAGPVGLSSVFQAGMLGMSSVVVDTLDSIGGQCTALYPNKPIYDIPAYPEISAQALIKRLQEQANPFNPQYLLGQTVEQLIEIKEGGWLVKTSKNTSIKCKALIIAGGCGAFIPNRPPLANIEAFEGRSIFYQIIDTAILKDKEIVIAGGGDSALDWALMLLSVAKKIYIVHRRDNFRGQPHSVEKLKKVSNLSGGVEFVIPYQLHGLVGDEAGLKAVEVIDFDGKIKVLRAEYLFAFFGLKMDLGPINTWGLNIDKHHIPVAAESMMTNCNGIFAVGDIASYPGKLKLILTGFAEGALACHSAYKYVFPDKALHFEYSTNKGIPNR